MAKMDLDTMSIDELASLRDRAIEKLAEKVAARQVELEAELERLSLFGKPVKKTQAALPAARRGKNEKSEEAREHVVVHADDQAANAA